MLNVITGVACYKGLRNSFPTLFAVLFCVVVFVLFHVKHSGLPGLLLRYLGGETHTQTNTDPTA